MIHGAIVTGEFAGMDMRNCILSHNQAGGTGGAVNFKGKVSMHSCVFENNTANYDGGAINRDGANAGASELQNCSFSKNKVGRFGGAICNGGGGGMLVHTCHLFENEAGRGGAIANTFVAAVDVHASVLFAIDNSTAFFPTVWKEWRKSSRRARLVKFRVEACGRLRHRRRRDVRTLSERCEHIARASQPVRRGMGRAGCDRVGRAVVLGDERRRERRRVLDLP